MNGLLVVLVLILSTIAIVCCRLRKQQKTSIDTSERRENAYAYEEIGTLDYRVIDEPPPIVERRPRAIQAENVRDNATNQYSEVDEVSNHFLTTNPTGQSEENISTCIDFDINIGSHQLDEDGVS